MSSTSFPTSNPLVAFSEYLAALVAQIEPTVVAVKGRSRFSSSGIYWQPGIIVTSESYLKRSEELTVLLADNSSIPAKLLGRDISTDIAVLQIEDPELPVAEISDNNSLQVGHLVLALGRSREDGLNASMGLISTIGEAWQSRNGGLIDRLIRPDLNLYPGLFGGPLVDVTGKVVGMNTSGPGAWL